jgi:hypothetical protein
MRSEYFLGKVCRSRILLFQEPQPYCAPDTSSVEVHVLEIQRETVFESYRDSEPFSELGAVTLAIVTRPAFTAIGHQDTTSLF